jgi:hypothetical protein
MGAQREKKAHKYNTFVKKKDLEGRLAIIYVPTKGFFGGKQSRGMRDSV